MLYSTHRPIIKLGSCIYDVQWNYTYNYIQRKWCRDNYGFICAQYQYWIYYIYRVLRQSCKA